MYVGNMMQFFYGEVEVMPFSVAVVIFFLQKINQLFFMVTTGFTIATWYFFGRFIIGEVEFALSYEKFEEV